MDTPAGNLRIGDAVYPGKGTAVKHVVALSLKDGIITIKYNEGSVDILQPKQTRHVLDNERKLP